MGLTKEAAVEDRAFFEEHVIHAARKFAADYQAAQVNQNHPSWKQRAIESVNSKRAFFAAVRALNHVLGDLEKATKAETQPLVTP